MKTMISVSMLAAMMALGVTSGAAQADERERCTWVRKCHRDDGRLQCHREKVCKMIHRDHRDGDRH
jgi:Ni/Co efflux regulator RcnB